MMDTYYLVGSIKDISTHAELGLVDCELYASKAEAEREVQRRVNNSIFHRIVMFKVVSP